MVSPSGWPVKAGIHLARSNPRKRTAFLTGSMQGGVTFASRSQVARPLGHRAAIILRGLIGIERRGALFDFLLLQPEYIVRLGDCARHDQPPADFAADAPQE